MGSVSAEAPGEQSNDYDHHTSIHHGRVLKVYCQDGRWSGRGGLGQRWRKWVSSEKQTDLPRLRFTKEMEYEPWWVSDRHIWWIGDGHSGRACNGHSSNVAILSCY